MGEFEKEVMDYIRQEMRKGFSQDEIRRELIRVGHDIEKIEKHFEHVHKHRKRKKHALLWSLIIVLTVYVLLLILADPVTYQPSETLNQTNQTSIDEQFFQQALRENDRAACNSITDPDLKKSCLMMVKPKAQQPEPKPAPDSSDGQKLREALQLQDYSKCQSIQDEFTRTDCETLLDFSRGHNIANEDANTQGGTTDSKIKDQEYMSMAIQSQDENYCYEIINKDQRSACLSTLSFGGN